MALQLGVGTPTTTTTKQGEFTLRTLHALEKKKVQCLCPKTSDTTVDTIGF